MVFIESFLQSSCSIDWIQVVLLDLTRTTLAYIGPSLRVLPNDTISLINIVCIQAYMDKGKELYLKHKFESHFHQIQNILARDLHPNGTERSLRALHSSDVWGHVIEVCK
jgi:hypothetical protein